ncbi:MAG: hypothetical protein IH621_01440 [Krumholzibacteria bacterium]|nr:hypothetical protein [Candidatus Krumholzibacteria bacterium]
MNEPSPEDKRLGEIIEAFNDLHLKYGADADRFIDYGAMFRSRRIVEHCRRSVENGISRRYLPGFSFRDTDHARWHFNNRDKLPFWIMDVDYGEEYWDENWIRSIFVPSYKHYCYEVAYALQRYDQSTAEAVKEFARVKETGDKAAVNRISQFLLFRRAGRNLPPGPINAPGGLMAMSPWTERLTKLFPEEVLPTTDRSLRRWPFQAVEGRRTRARRKPPSGWYIDYLCYFGDIPCPDVQDPDVWSEKFHDYIESWKWAPIEGCPDPQRKSISFRSVASADLWNASAVRTRYKYDD